MALIVAIAILHWIAYPAICWLKADRTGSRWQQQQHQGQSFCLSRYPTMDLELGIICSELAKWGCCGLTLGIFAYGFPLTLLTGFTFNCEEAHVDGLGPFVFVYFPMIGIWFLGDTVCFVTVASSVMAITSFIPTILLFRYGMALFYACAIFYAGSIQVKYNLQNDSAIHALMGHDQEENYEASMECPNAPHTYDYEETVALLEAYLGRLETEKCRTLIAG